MTLTEGTSTEIDQHVREQPIRDASELRERYVAGTFGQGVADLPPIPTMPARYHLLSEIEQDVERVRDRLELAGETALLDELFRFRDYLFEQMTAESEGDAA